MKKLVLLILASTLGFSCADFENSETVETKITTDSIVYHKQSSSKITVKKNQITKESQSFFKKILSKKTLKNVTKNTLKVIGYCLAPVLLSFSNELVDFFVSSGASVFLHFL